MHFVPLYTAQRQQLHSVHINAAWIKCQGHFLVAFSCCCCCSAATAGDDATCFSQTVARSSSSCCCVLLSRCLSLWGYVVMPACVSVCLKMRCNIQVSDVNASRTQRTNKQTDSRSRERVKGRERQTESDCSGAWSKSSWPAGRQAGNGQRATGNGQEIRRAVMPVKMNAISSHRKWCQNVSRGPVETPFLALSLPACTAARTAASCCYPGELWVLQSCAISNRTKRTPRLSSLCLASSTPLTSPWHAV